MTTGGRGKVRGRKSCIRNARRLFPYIPRVASGTKPGAASVQGAGQESCISNARRLLVPYMYISGVARLFGRVETGIDDAGASEEDCLPC